MFLKYYQYLDFLSFRWLHMLLPFTFWWVMALRSPAETSNSQFLSGSSLLNSIIFNHDVRQFHFYIYYNKKQQKNKICSQADKLMQNSQQNFLTHSKYSQFHSMEYCEKDWPLTFRIRSSKLKKWGMKEFSDRDKKKRDKVDQRWGYQNEETRTKEKIIKIQEIKTDGGKYKKSYCLPFIALCLGGAGVRTSTPPFLAAPPPASTASGHLWPCPAWPREGKQKNEKERQHEKITAQAKNR